MDCFVAYNMQECEQEIALPSLGKKKVWHRSFTTDEGQLHAEEMAGELLEDNQRKIMVPARTIVLVVGR